MKASNIYLFFTLLFIFITGCKNSFISKQYETSKSESQVITLSTQTDFTIENTNGNIIISSSDTAKNIYCNITKKVKSGVSKDDAQAHLPDISINTSKTGTGIKIKIDHPKNDDRNYQTDFGILMPDNFNYNLNLGNGKISVNSSTRNLIVNIGNGKADAEVVLADKCNVSMSIGNGSIDLKIPESTNAAVNAIVGNGSISNEGFRFEDLQSSSRKLQGKLGSGTGSIVLSVGNGSINVSKQ